MLRTNLSNYLCDELANGTGAIGQELEELGEEEIGLGAGQVAFESGEVVELRRDFNGELDGVEEAHRIVSGSQGHHSRHCNPKP